MSNLLGPRDANGIPVPMTVDESIASMKASLLKNIKRSAYVYRVDCGGCNGCEIEIFATLSPLFDAETLYGFAMALGLLEQKIHARAPGELDDQPAEILHPDMVQPLRVKVDRAARRLAGYRYGRQIADDYLTQLGQGEQQVARWLEAENDPRLTEIVTHLNHVVEEARIR